MSKWKGLLDRYLNDPDTNEIVFVKYLKDYDAEVSMYKKTGTGWNELFTCIGQVGQNGIGKEKDGDRKTPVGIFDLSFPFGLAEDPGTPLGYTRINEHLYWCDDKEHYNKLIDIREHPHECSGEHLINYDPDYTYAMYIGYNNECEYGKGCAIFFHCFGTNPYTLGCVAIEKENMKTVLLHAHAGAKICIFEK